jgi:ankyrin repeat protein
MMRLGFKPDTGCFLRAAAKGSFECLQTLLTATVTSNIKDLQLEGSLYAAIRNEQTRVVDLLLNAGVDVNARSCFGHNCETLYMKGFRYGYEPRTALQVALMVGNTEITDLLLDHGADVHAPAAPESGATALQLAAIQGLIGIARKLLDMDVDCNEAPAACFGRTALEGAAEHGRIDMLQLLLDSGVKITGTEERHYFRAIKFASENGHHAAATLLREFRPWDENDYVLFDLVDLSERHRSWPSVESLQFDIYLDNGQASGTQGTMPNRSGEATRPLHDLVESEQQDGETNTELLDLEQLLPHQELLRSAPSQRDFGPESEFQSLDAGGLQQSEPFEGMSILGDNLDEFFAEFLEMSEYGV